MEVTTQRGQLRRFTTRNNGGRGLKSVEEEYKNIKIKAAVKLYENTDPSMTNVTEFEEKSLKSGRHSLVKDAQRFAEERKLHLQLDSLEPTLIKEDGELIIGSKVKACLDTARQQQYQEKTEQGNWQGKLMKNRWADDNLDRDGCFAWLHHLETALTHTVAGLQELYQQLLPTKVYHNRKTGMSGDADECCRLCGKTCESVGHILTGCSAIAQTQYLARHNKALKILFFEMLISLNLSSTTAPWYSQANQNQFTRTIE